MSGLDAGDLPGYKRRLVERLSEIEEDEHHILMSGFSYIITADFIRRVDAPGADQN